MTKTFDENDILRFIYEEMSPAESDAFVAAMCEDESLMAKYEELLEGKMVAEQLPLYEPSEATYDKIMEFVHTGSTDIELTEDLDISANTPEPAQTTIIKPLHGRVKIFSLQVSYATLAACITLTLIFGTTIALFRYTPLQNVYSSQPEGVTRTISPMPQQDAATLQWNDATNDAKIKQLKQKVDTLKKKKDW